MYCAAAVKRTIADKRIVSRQCRDPVLINGTAAPIGKIIFKSIVAVQIEITAVTDSAAPSRRIVLKGCVSGCPFVTAAD